jgi:hypothetical protein
MTETNEPTIHVAPAPYVTVKMFAAISGLSEKAVRRKMEEGKWVEGREYRRSPDGGIFISIRDYSKWVESAALKSERSPSASTSRSMESSTASA